MNIDALNLTFTILSIMIPVFATIYTAYSRIRNENREQHKPYLILDEIISNNSIDEYNYYFKLEGKNVQQNNKEIVTLPITLNIKNIGYGVASNIKFYNLFTGEEIKGNQLKDSNKIQKLFTTLDIAAPDEKNIQASIAANLNDNKEDQVRILCIYKDLNENAYDFIININIKSEDKYDFFAYQRSSHSYKNIIINNKKEYKEIYKKYDIQ